MVPEMIVLSKFPWVQCACVHVHACVLMQLSTGRVSCRGQVRLLAGQPPPLLLSEDLYLVE